MGTQLSNNIASSPGPEISGKIRIAMVKRSSSHLPFTFSKTILVKLTITHRQVMKGKDSMWFLRLIGFDLWHIAPIEEGLDGV